MSGLDVMNSMSVSCEWYDTVIRSCTENWSGTEYGELHCGRVGNP